MMVLLAMMVLRCGPLIGRGAYAFKLDELPLNPLTVAARHVEIPAAVFEESNLDPEELAIEMDADDVVITNDGATVRPGGAVVVDSSVQALGL
jgi:hypothetical protein